MNILALIPARSGSKGVPHKNIRLFHGKPLLAHSIAHALGSELITRTIVSTDSPEYAKIANQYGAETPFLRPSEISQDLSTDLEVIEHALNWLKEKESYVPDILVHLRPTYPIRNIKDIDSIIQILIDKPDIDSVRSVASTPETPFKMWFRSDDGYLKPVVQSNIKDAHSLPRQALPTVYLQNACIDAVRVKTILEQKSIAGTNIFGYVMVNNFDIDTELQFQAAQAALNHGEISSEIEQLRQQLASGGKIIFCFDIDGVVANLTPGNQYNLATPQPHIVTAINRLYDKSCYIILFTARGSATGLDWQAVTHQQMANWGVKYHELLFGKPAAHYYIDDKFVSLEWICKLSAEL